MTGKTYMIAMPPFAKARPRVTKNRTFMPPEYMAKKELLQALFLEAGGQLNMSGPIELTVMFWFKMPQSWSKKKRAQIDGSWCMKKPDLDNCLGAVMDALFDNDSHIVHLRGYKMWSKEDSIFIIIRQEET